MLGVGIIRLDSCVVNHSYPIPTIDVVRHQPCPHLPSQEITHEQAKKSAKTAIGLK